MRTSRIFLLPRFPLAIVFAIFGMTLLSGCNWFGLPDVSILKTQYPVVHYVPPPKFSGWASGKLIKNGERPRESYILSRNPVRQLGQSG